MHSGNSNEKNTFSANSELTLKIATGVVGVLYVLGLLVSNMHLMTLGISDFTSLQARNVMTGFLFVLYSSFLLPIAIPISMAIYLCGRTVKSSSLQPFGKFAEFVKTTGRALFFTVSAMFLAGAILGYMSPWGTSSEASFTWTAFTWQGMVSGLHMSYVQFIEAFWNPYIIGASFIITVGLVPLASRIS